MFLIYLDHNQPHPLTAPCGPHFNALSLSDGIDYETRCIHIFPLYQACVSFVPVCGFHDKISPYHLILSGYRNWHYKISFPIVYFPLYRNKNVPCIVNCIYQSCKL